jgi:thiamine-monophosphate kinase
VKRGSVSETAIIERLERLLGGASSRNVVAGIGDDAAVLRSRRAPLVWTVDTSVDGVHFDQRWLSPEDIGARSFHAAVSDLAAMGARPLAALSSVIVPSTFPERRLLALASGQAEAARTLACPIVGGNLSRGGELSVTTTVLGAAKRPLTRAGARAGDEVWLLGDVGLAAAGLLLLRRRGARRVPGELRTALDVCVGAWRRPAARIADGLRLVGRARAAIDVSDGLATDAAHLGRRSRVRIVLDEAALGRALRPELVASSALLRVTPLSLALSGGEDYALLATGPSGKRPRGAACIGRVERGKGVELVDEKGARRPLAATGFDHFRAPKRR